MGTYTGNGNCGTDAYDDLNRLLKRDYSDGTPAVTYQYDLAITAQQPLSCQGTNTVTNAAWDTSGAVGQLASVSNSVSTSYYF